MNDSVMLLVTIDTKYDYVDSDIKKMYVNFCANLHEDGIEAEVSNPDGGKGEWGWEELVMIYMGFQGIKGGIEMVRFYDDEIRSLIKRMKKWVEDGGKKRIATVINPRDKQDKMEIKKNALGEVEMSEGEYIAEFKELATRAYLREKSSKSDSGKDS